MYGFIIIGIAILWIKTTLKVGSKAVEEIKKKKQEIDYI